MDKGTKQRNKVVI